jgi:L,D-peptidoglycan transpeptidase YkuD (ErfK/YbiS/YcfS/YnhG family)
MPVLSDVITVLPDSKDASRGQMRVGDQVFLCRLGRNGVRVKKQEGDGVTPAGRFNLRYVLYRADRAAAPATALPTTLIERDDGWCDDPADSFYNRTVKLPYPARAENMWRGDNQYDVVVVIGHNDNPVVAGRGSAIFIHIAAENGSPTAGCIALSSADMLEMLKGAGSETTIEIREDHS